MNDLLILNIGLLLGMFVQTTIGFAASLVAMPILLIVFDLPDAIAYLATFMLLFSLIMLPKNWRHIDKKLLLSLSISGVIGLVLGIWLLNYANPLFLKKLLGGFVVAYVGYQYFKKNKIKLPKALNPLFGFLGGLFSGLFNSGGAILLMYVHSRLSSVIHLRATIIGLLAVSNLLRVPLMVQNGLLSKEIFIQSLWSIPIFIIALFLGHLFYNGVDKELLKHLIMFFLLVTGMILIIQ